MITVAEKCTEFGKITILQSRIKGSHIYCQEDCWMSWNAAKRVLSYGYSNVAWYREGTDGWERANLPVAEAQPEPGASLHSPNCCISPKRFQPSSSGGPSEWLPMRKR